MWQKGRGTVAIVVGALFLVGCGRPAPGTLSQPLSPTAMVVSAPAPTETATPSSPACPTPAPATAAVPPPRIGAALAYDGVSGKLLLFSGVRGDGTPQSCPTWIFNDTWAWDGLRWSQLHPPASPPGRSFGNMTFDEGNRKTILFGGGSGNSDAGRQDTWSWDGTSWTLLHPPSSPDILIEGSIAYSVASRSVVLFGPGGSRFQSQQTWTWDGTTWLNPQPAVAPSFRVQAAMAYDAARRFVVLFGGYAGGNQQLNDTWTWDGGQWQQRRPQTSPPGGSPYAAYHPVRQEVVLFVNGETWSWDGSNWAQRHPALSPPPRIFASMVYDPATGKVVLFGGKTFSVSGGIGVEQVTNDLWSWDGTTWKQEA